MNLPHCKIENPKLLRAQLARWFRRNRRDLPWRRTRDPYAVLVAELDGEAAGYVTCHLASPSNRGSIGLIAVSEDARGQGLGGELVFGALGWCSEHGAAEVSVVTQGANIAAQRLFQLCGFRTASLGLWFHRWYER